MPFYIPVLLPDGELIHVEDGNQGGAVLADSASAMGLFDYRNSGWLETAALPTPAGHVANTATPQQKYDRAVIRLSIARNLAIKDTIEGMLGFNFSSRVGRSIQSLWIRVPLFILFRLWQAILSAPIYAASFLYYPLRYIPFLIGYLGENEKKGAKALGVLSHITSIAAAIAALYFLHGKDVVNKPCNRINVRPHAIWLLILSLSLDFFLTARVMQKTIDARKKLFTGIITPHWYHLFYGTGVWAMVGLVLGGVATGFGLSCSTDTSLRFLFLGYASLLSDYLASSAREKMENEMKYLDPNETTIGNSMEHGANPNLLKTLTAARATAHNYQATLTQAQQNLERTTKALTDAQATLGQRQQALDQLPQPDPTSAASTQEQARQAIEHATSLRDAAQGTVNQAQAESNTANTSHQQAQQHARTLTDAVQTAQRNYDADQAELAQRVQNYAEHVAKLHLRHPGTVRAISIFTQIPADIEANPPHLAVPPAQLCP